MCSPASPPWGARWLPVGPWLKRLTIKQLSESRPGGEIILGALCDAHGEVTMGPAILPGAILQPPPCERHPAMKRLFLAVLSLVLLPTSWAHGQVPTLSHLVPSGVQPGKSL